MSAQVVQNERIGAALPPGCGRPTDKVVQGAFWSLYDLDEAKMPRVTGGCCCCRKDRRSS